MTQNKINEIEKKIRECCLELMGGHHFNIGFAPCIHCNEPRILYDRKVENVILDEKSGGSSCEITERTIDQTDFPCLQNSSHKEIHLEHLLRAMPFPSKLQTLSGGEYLEFNDETTSPYDLTKSFPENLKSTPQLVELLWEVLVGKK